MEFRFRLLGRIGVTVTAAATLLGVTAAFAVATPSPGTLQQAAALCASQGGSFSTLSSASYLCESPSTNQFSNKELSKARHECVVSLSGTFSSIAGATNGTYTTDPGYECQT